jgi:hypothetical protein
VPSPSPTVPEVLPGAPQGGPLPGQGLPLSAPLAYPLLIQIENTDLARPQAGIGAASVVFQYLTEGGIARFSALFHRVPGVVGPVRSTRFVTVYLYRRMGALLMTSGSNKYGYDMIFSDPGTAALINDFDNGQHFFRWSGRAAPHNVYTTQAQMLNAAALGARAPKRDDFLRSTTWTGTLPAASVSVPTLNTSFNYLGDGTYEVISEGSRENDVIFGPDHPRSVVVMHVRQWVTNLTDPKGGALRDHDLASGGAAELYANGTMIQASWAAGAGKNGPLTFVDAGGNVIGMPPGLMWVILPP